MPSTELHYLFDPLCGWCYGAAPLVAEARKIVRVVPHAIGMMTGARRRAVTPQLRAFVAPHDARIAQTSGQPFGVGYLDGLLHDTGAVFDSAPPTAAILAAAPARVRARVFCVHCWRPWSSPPHWCCRVRRRR